MPYSGADDPDLPDNVKDLPENEREQWVAIWNDTYESCVDDGGSDCESKAFETANGVVMENAMPDKKSILAQFQEAVTKVTNLFHEPEERATSLDDLLWNVYEQVYDRAPMAWINGFYMESGEMFVVIADEGKLFKAGIAFGDEAATLDDNWEEVVIDFVPRSKEELEGIRSIVDNKNAEATHIVRMKDGRYRWVSVSCSAVLNRSGAIDSRDLMDSFIESIERGASYPIRDFFHLGEQFRTGQTDFISREGYLLITSGLYDQDNELADYEVKARLKDPSYWGDSIEFIATEEPETLEVMDGVELTVYNKGVLMAISTLPEENAAALFTSQTNLEEVTRMNKRTYDAFVKLLDGDEEKAQAFLEGIEPTNRQIEDEDLVARESEEPEVEPETETPDETVESEEDEVEVEAEGDDEVVTQLEIDEDTLPQLREAIFDDDRFQALLETPALIVSLAGDVSALTDQIAERDSTIQELTERLAAVERSDAEKREEWSLDIGEKARNVVNLSYRPKRDKDTDAVEDPVSDTDAHVDEILKRVPKYTP